MPGCEVRRGRLRPAALCVCVGLMAAYLVLAGRRPARASELVK